MTDNNHPITPPPELVQQWRAAASNVPATLSTDSGGRRDYIDFIATQAAQWGADEELEECLSYAGDQGLSTSQMRNHRRRSPPSLKTQALAVLDDASDRLDAAHENTIRRALEQLND